MLVEAEGVDEKDKWWFSVYDFIDFVCDKYHNRTYAHTAFLRLTKDGSEHQKPVLTDCKYCQFPGARQRNTPCMTLRGLQRLLMILGGKVAAEYRAIAEGIFTRYIAGDPSLLPEIRANASSDAPVHQAFRAAMEMEPVTGKRKEMEDLDISERQSKLADMHVKPQEVSIKNIQAFAETMSMLDAEWKLDARLLIKITTTPLLGHACER